MEHAFFLETNINLHLASFRLRSLSSINVAMLSRVDFQRLFSSTYAVSITNSKTFPVST